MKKPDHRHRSLLRPRCKRPGCRRASKQRDELAPGAHSITSSARASSVGRISRPRVFAVVRLIDHLKLGREFDRQISRLGALQYAINVVCRPMQAPDQIDTIANETAGVDMLTVRVDRR